MIPDLAAPIRAALVGETDITDLLPAYLGSYPVFTRRPVPDDAPYPMIVVSPDIGDTVTQQAGGSSGDGVRDFRPALERDVVVYGKNEPAQNYRDVETIARAVRALFHRARTSISVSGWAVVQVTATAPRAAPTDDEQTVGRVVTLTVQLARTY